MQCVLPFPLSLYLKLIIFGLLQASIKVILLFMFTVVCTVVYVLFVFLISFLLLFGFIYTKKQEPFQEI